MLVAGSSRKRKNSPKQPAASAFMIRPACRTNCCALTSKLCTASAASAALSTASVCSWLQRSAPLLYAFQKTPSTQKDPAVCKSKGRAQSWRQCLGLKGLECTGGDLFHDGTNTAAKQQVRNCQRRAVTTNAHRAGA